MSLEAHVFPENYTKTYHKGSEKPIEYTVNELGCWINISHSRNKKGYSDICRNNQRTKLHRYVYEQTHEDVLSDDVLIMHTCDNPPCINPGHLTKGTIDQNNKDKTIKGRQTKGEAVHTAKLTRQQVIVIRNDGRSARSIAKAYGVAHSTICRIKKGENWKDESHVL